MNETDEFDRPFFKLLAHNDTPAAKGNQGGFLIPNSVTRYFPELRAPASSTSPTVEKWIRAELYVATKRVGTVNTRYQYQTRGGTRKPEFRITGGLGAMLEVAAKDDAIVIERNLTDRSLYRLVLLKTGTLEHQAIIGKFGKKRWGPLDPSDPPLPEVEFEAAETSQRAHELAPLALFENDAALTETKTKRIARSQAFKKLTTKYYGNKCAVCGEGFITLDGRIEVEAAHIVPRGRRGADDARNGIALCRKHHWAFDNGLWAVGADRNIIVSPASAGLGSNSQLNTLSGKPPRLPNVIAMSPDAAAYAWHHENIFNK